MTGKKAKIITAVGAGGKTTYLRMRAEEYLRSGKRAVITTTTHIWKPEGADGEGCLFRVPDGIDYAGTLQESGKLAMPPEYVWDQLCAQYDAVLVEGDGSHCMPVKIPGPGEPVIPEETDEIAVIMGRQAEGRTLSVVCHRYDERKLPDQAVTDRMLEELAKEFYIEPLRRNYPRADVFYVPSAYEPERCRKPLPVTAVLLASGFGRRFGSNKLTERFGEKQLYLHALHHITEALGKEHVVVVTQYRSILEDMEREGICALHNDSAAEGISASIRIGTEEAVRRDGCRAVLFFAADMPFLPAEEIRMYAHQFLWSGKTYGCMVSGPEHVMTNPGAFLLYGADGRQTAAAAQLSSLHGDRGAMRIIRQNPQDIYFYQIGADEVRDIDVPV